MTHRPPWLATAWNEATCTTNRPAHPIGLAARSPLPARRPLALSARLCRTAAGSSCTIESTGSLHASDLGCDATSRYRDAMIPLDFSLFRAADFTPACHRSRRRLGNLHRKRRGRRRSASADIRTMLRGSEPLPRTFHRAAFGRLPRRPVDTASDLTLARGRENTSTTARTDYRSLSEGRVATTRSDDGLCVADSSSLCRSRGIS